MSDFESKSKDLLGVDGGNPGSWPTNLVYFLPTIESTMLRLIDGFITSPKSFTGTGLGRQFDHGFTSVRPVQPPSSAVGLPVAGYADPSRTSVRPRLAASSTIGLPVVAIPTPLTPHLRPFDFFNLTRATGRRHADPSLTPLTPVCFQTAEPRLRKIKMPTASRIPKRSPIQVLTGPDAA